MSHGGKLLKPRRGSDRGEGMGPADQRNKREGVSRSVIFRGIHQEDRYSGRESYVQGQI